MGESMEESHFKAIEKSLSEMREGVGQSENFK